jgi:hypothetical protein
MEIKGRRDRQNAASRHHADTEEIKAGAFMLLQ